MAKYVLTKEVRYNKSMYSQLMFYFAVLRSPNNPKLLQTHNVPTRYTNSDFTRTNIHYGDFPINTLYEPHNVCCEDFY